MEFDAILFDLDDTLVVEEEAMDEALVNTCRMAESRCGAPAEALCAAVKEKAGELWRRLPAYGYCRGIGVSSREALWAYYGADPEPLAALQGLVAEYRLGAWSEALKALGVDDRALAGALAARLPAERRRLHRRMPGAGELLDFCRGRYRLGLVTNGSPGLQREKIEGAAVGGYFDAVAISGGVGFGKPSAEIFSAALERLGARPGRCLMVGDSLSADIAGANAMGIYAVWFNREGKALEGDARPDSIVRRLEELKDHLQ